MHDRSISESSLLISRTGIPYDEPDNRRSYQRQLAICLILASTALERLAFYSLVINLVITLQKSELGWDPGNSITVSFIFSGISYIWTLIFAALSDAKFGRAKTIIVGFCLYIIGYVFIILITNESTHRTLCGSSSINNNTHVTEIADEHCFGRIIGTLIFTATGVGAVQANMAVFGVEQVRESDKPLRYFDKYVIAVNTGGFLATLLVSYIQDFQDGPNRFFYGYVFAGSSLLAAIFLFIVGVRFYRHITPHDTIITKYIPVIINAFQTWRKHKSDKGSMVGTHANTPAANPLFDSMSVRFSRQIHINEKLPSFLDYARASNNGKYIDRIVDDVKTLQRVIVVFLLLIPYWLIYYQTQTTFFLQGQHMSIPYISKNPDTKMPVIWVSIGDQLAIFIGIAIFNLFVYKHLESYDPSDLIQTKFIVGMLFASITMFIAGTVEIFRQDYCDIGRDTSSLSIFIQLPQYICMGISEVFAMVASYEFAYMAAPRSAQSLIMSLRFCSLGLSSFIGDAYVKIFTGKHEQFEFDCMPRQETFYIYFYVLGGIQLFAIIAFTLCSRKFRILQLNQRIINRKLFI